MTNATTIDAGHPKPVEDIESIIRKYSAWASSRSATSPVTPKVSEVSYEKALRSTQFHRKVAHALKTPEVTNVDSLSIPITDDSRLVKSLDSKRSRGKTGAKVSARSPKEPRDNVDKQHRQRSPQQRARDKERKAVRRAPLVKDLRNDGDRISLSIRLSAAEGAAVKSRAAEAQMSNSAYLRWCALEVEAGRERGQNPASVLVEECCFSAAMESRLVETQTITTQGSTMCAYGVDFFHSALKKARALVLNSIEKAKWGW